jgi:hypothetical protein
MNAGRNVCSRSLQQRRHGPIPHGEDQDHVIGSDEDLLRLPNGFGCRSTLEIRATPQEWKLDPGHVDHHDLLARLSSAARIGVGQRMAEMVTLRIGMSLDEGHALRDV